MAIEDLYQDTYMRILFGSIILFVGTFLTYIKKVKAKFENHERILKERIENRPSFQEYSPRNVINIIKESDELDNKLSTISSSFDLNLWSGIILVISSIIGFILRNSGMKEDLAIMGIFLGGIFFVISLIIIIYWDSKN